MTKLISMILGSVAGTLLIVHFMHQGAYGIGTALLISLAYGALLGAFHAFVFHEERK